MRISGWRPVEPGGGSLFNSEPDLSIRHSETHSWPLSEPLGDGGALFPTPDAPLCESGDLLLGLILRLDA